MSNVLCPGSKHLTNAAKATTASRAHGLRRWGKADKQALETVLEYVRRSYKVPGATFPRLVPIGMGGIPHIACGNHCVARFTSFETAWAAETIARQAAEACQLPI